MTSPKRAETNDVLGVSMSKDLKARIKALADADRRPMATWCAIHLAEIVEQMESARNYPPLESHPIPQQDHAEKQA